MAKITWLGEDTEKIPGPSFTIWGGVKFPKGVAVDVTDPDRIVRARRNRFFKVDDGETKRGPGRPPKPVETDGADKNS